MRNYPKFYITKKGERAVRGGKIRVRILSTNTNDRFEEAFWERRLQYALDYRKTVMPGDDFKCCRLIFGEADQFPGWTVDRYNDLLVIQTLSLGMEQRKHMLIPLLVKLLRKDGETITGVYERNDVKIRLLEGLEEGKGWFAMEGEVPPASPVTTICENGIVYDVDVENGQKTGFFLDQKYNRQSVARIAKGKHVLDCFTHTGSFALNAAKGGAAHVTAVDVSGEACRMTALNSAGRCVCIAGQTGGGTQSGLRFYHSGSAGLYQEPQDGAKRHRGLQRHQHESHEAVAPGRISGHLQLLAFYERRTVCGNAA